jgi:hypothetical protein
VAILLELYPALLQQNEYPVKILARRWKDLASVVPIKA